MRLARATLWAVVLLAGCTKEASRPLASAPSTIDAGEAPRPSAADLAAPFRVIAVSTNGLSGYENKVEVTGDTAGADVAVFTREPLRGDQTEPRSDLRLYRLDAQGVARLWAKLDAFQWWALGDSQYRVQTDGTDHVLEVKRGAFGHRYRVYVACGTGDRDVVFDEESERTGAPKIAPPLPCPQTDAITAVQALGAALAAEPGAQIAPPEVATFEPEKLSPPRGQKLGAVEVISGPGATFAYEGRRCYRQDKLLACFHSPFPDFAWGELYRLKQTRDPPAEPGPPPDPARHVWAFVTAEGARCYGSPLPTNFPRWMCVTSAQGATGDLVTRLAELERGGLVAYDQSKGRWVRVVRVYR